VSIPALSVRNLCVSFPGRGGPERVVDGISFDLSDGEIVGLVGESGCGKSVTSLALMGLIPPHLATTSVDSIQLFGTEISTLNARGWQKIRGKDMAMIFQEPATALDPVFTIGQQISQVLRRHGTMSKASARQKALDALEQGGFSDPQQVFNAYPHHLSGGMRQLTMVALAMATRPRVLIADEPTTALDVSTQSLLLEQLRKLRDNHGTAVLLVSHDLGVVAQCCTRAMVMYCGRLVEQGNYSDLYRQPRHPYTAGLLASIPRIAAGQPVRTHAIPGRIPTPSELPIGCHFADRCKRADGLCRQRFPAQRKLQGTQVACHHPL